MSTAIGRLNLYAETGVRTSTSGSYALAFRIEAGEPLPDGIRRIVSEQIDTARTAHAGGGPSEEDPVHEARKSCKKIRAILRLVRDHIGSDVYASENRIFRDIGRALSSARDGTVLLETASGASN